MMDGNGVQAGSFRYGGASGRRTAILQRLRRTGYVSLIDLGHELEVSDRTVRRDLAEMADEGAVQLVPGGAILPSGSVTVQFPSRAAVEMDTKRILARRAAGMVAPGDSVALDAGTTIGCVADALNEVTPLTVITHSLEVIEQLSEQSGVSLISVGGSYDLHRRAFLGPMTRENLRSIRASIAFLGCSGVDGTDFACGSQPDAEIKQALLTMSAKRVLVASSTVFDRTAPIVMFGFDRVDTLVTDSRLREGDYQRLIDAGVEVVRVEIEDTEPQLVN